MKERPNGDFDESKVRLDKWLWAARFYKTRALAHKAIEVGRVSIDGERAKPSRTVYVGMALSINMSGVHWDIFVEKISARRGSGIEAKKLYRETEESVSRREKLALLKKNAASIAPRERPNSQTRVLIRKMKEGG